ncbi:2-dehydro-3-deoxygalactonokinase [uncultured Devosia sp.]|uniref:2-dehydro-3-deoxygalactonokinase n=1 Tax=uncultured Devosia sp. TaxID=211434 RepID=UPI0035CA0005
MNSSVDWVAVDWGTSNLRAWGIDDTGGIAFAKTSPNGMGKLAREQFAGALTELLADVEGPAGRPISVLICGMAGARQGWLEAPYLQAPTDLRALLDGAVHPEMPDARFRPTILPGVCQKMAGSDNVMRGEETQLLGLAALNPGFSGVVCMPGTHSKWAQLSGTHIERFATAMTGELFEVLRTHSVLRHSLDGDLEGPGRGEGFAVGVQAGLDHPERLLGELFEVRAGSLLSGRQPDWCAGYLSGLLIGSEIGANRVWIGDAEVPLIGSAALCGLYGQALDRIGVRSRLVDATEAVLAGLKAARQFSN